MDNKNQFDIDVTLNGGYLYTGNAKLSSCLANERLTKAVLKYGTLSNRTVLDVGCGDGAYTYQYFKRGKPKSITGIDISIEAIKTAKNKYKSTKGINFYYRDIYSLSKNDIKADMAIVRGVIHHVDDPDAAIQSVSHTADEILIVEPNGYNPLLKIIEKISPYHKAHGEKSYFPFMIRNWLKRAGYKKILTSQYINLVPFFFPEAGAKILNIFEPYVESIPLASRLACGVYVVHAIKQ